MSTMSMSQVKSGMGSAPINQKPRRVSSAFKSIGRTTKAFWGNRFERDRNDLDYDIKYELIKGKADLNHNNSTKRATTAMSRKTSLSRPGTSPVKLAGDQKTQNRTQLMIMNKAVEPEKYSMEEDKLYSTIETGGLCKYEFDKTIQGQLAHKSNLHLQFQSQTNRIKNINPVWYNPDADVNLQKMISSMQIKHNSSNNHKIGQAHPFSSYTQRKVFEPREQLDKFYNTKKAANRCTARRIKQTVKISKISGRKQPFVKHSNRLAYNEYESRKTVERRSISHEISKSARVFKIPPQVINSSRGCYR